MKAVDQEIVDVGFGDCTRACVASLLELELDAVPNFIRFGGHYARVMVAFLDSVGYKFWGTGFPIGGKYPRGDKLDETYNIDGYVMASVPSKTFKDIGHSVVMDLNGLVVHDPNPNKLWQDINVLETGDLQHWTLIERARKLSDAVFGGAIHLKR